MKKIFHRWVKPCLALVRFSAALLALPCSPGHGHELGNGADDLTPPLLREADEIAALQQDFGGAAIALRGVFDGMKIWSVNNTLEACFYDGDEKLKLFFVQAVQRWLSGTSLKVDFGDAIHGFRECKPLGGQDIRVTFAKKGYWSYIGTDSIHPSVVEKGASLNVQTDGLPFEKLNKQALEEKILHEFGHALGLLHEHQSPKSDCGREFDWPKIFDYGQKMWGWDEAKIKHNFEQYTSLPRLRTTRYDRASVMHYALPAWMFRKGEKSKCYVSRRRAISELDRATILDAYPASVAMQDKALQRRADLAGAAMAALDLDATQLALAGVKIAQSMRHFDRKISLQFALAPQGAVRGSGALNPCEGESLQMATIPSISCGVALDGSGLVIEINPEASRQ